MKKPLLGILVIFCLQAGFVAYNSIETSLTEALNAISVGDPLAGMTQAPVKPDNEFSIAAMTTEPTEMVAAKGRDRNRNAARIPERARAFRRSAVASSRRPSEAKFNDDADRASVRQPFVFEFEEQPKEPAEKRSFIGKTLPYIKKPYSWIKSLASKIN